MGLHVRKNDTVMIMAGKGAAGSKKVTGRVLKVFPKKNRVLVEGYNMVKRHTKPSARNQKGGIVEKEAPIHISNVMVVSAKSGRPLRIGSHTNETDGKKLRFSHKHQEEIA